jgi:hypothetical protein
MLVVKRIIGTIKQLGKGDNARLKPPDVTQFYKNNSLRNVIKIIFDVNLHHGPIMV